MNRLRENPYILLIPTCIATAPGYLFWCQKCDSSVISLGCLLKENKREHTNKMTKMQDHMAVLTTRLKDLETQVGQFGEQAPQAFSGTFLSWKMP